MNKNRNAGILPASAGGTPAARKNPLQKRGWHSRGYLPHWDPGNRPVHVVLRLHDSLPQHLLTQWEEELRRTPDATDQRRRRIEAALDQGIGRCWLRKPAVARLVAEALTHFDGQHYHLHAWVIMPNHVHVLITTVATATLAEIEHSWKSYTAKQANRLLARSGQFWQKECFDRVMRNRRETAETKIYIEANPVAAGLCASIYDWPWSSAARNAGILPAQAGGTPAVRGTSGLRIKSQRRATVREPNLFNAAEAAE